MIVLLSAGVGRVLSSVVSGRGVMMTGSSEVAMTGSSEVVMTGSSEVLMTGSAS